MHAPHTHTQHDLCICVCVWCVCVHSLLSESLGQRVNGGCWQLLGCLAASAASTSESNAIEHTHKHTGTHTYTHSNSHTHSYTLLFIHATACHAAQLFNTLQFYVLPHSKTDFNSLIKLFPFFFNFFLIFICK